MAKISKDDNLYLIIKKNFDIDFFVKLIFFISLLFIIYINVINAKQPILEQHSFRQTQTALTSYYLKSDGFRFNYQTPVIGEKWSIPFEFPIYQQIVAALSAIMESSLTSMTEIGRLVSLAFILLTCIPLYFSLTRFHLENNAIYFSLALYLSSPVYLFWAGTFMIEGAALFFTSSFLYYAIKIAQRDWTNRNFIFFSLFLSLALLQKITTVLPGLFVVVVTTTFFIVRLKDFNENSSSLLKLAISIFLPILIGYLWVKFSDSIKMLNPIGVKLTSSNLATFNYGRLDQRLSKQLWLDVIYNRNIKKSSFLFFGLSFVFIAIFQVKEKFVNQTVIFSFLLFLLPFLVFTNLHIRHDYYQAANSVFLSVSVGVSVIYVCNHFLKNRPMIFSLVLASIILSNYYFFYIGYYPFKTTKITSNNRTLMLANFIKINTPKERPIIWYGCDWSGEYAFYSERKSLTVPDWDSFEVDAISKTERFLKDPPSAIVLCQTKKNNDLIRMFIHKKYGIVDPKKIAGCEVYIL